MDNATQEKLFAATIPLFAKKGYAAVSIREIAKAADVNVSSISYYFRGKEGLYHAIIESHVATIAKAVLSAESLSPEERLRNYAKAISEVHTKKPYVARFIQSELVNPTSAMDKILKKNLFSFYRYLNKAIQDGIDTGLFRADLNVHHAALSLVGILNFYFIAKPLFRDFLDTSVETDADYAEQAVTIYLEGIRRK